MIFQEIYKTGKKGLEKKFKTLIKLAPKLRILGFLSTIYKQL